MQCDLVAHRLPEMARHGADDADPDAIGHVEQCLRCQAELVQYRRLLRALRTLRTDVLEPAPGLLADLLAALEEEAERQAVGGLLRGRRIAYFGGLAAATAAAAGGAIVLANRSRRRLKLVG